MERLSDDPIVVALNVLPRFTAAEEVILSEPVPEAEIRIKPTGQIYLSHPTYIRWLNRALGRGQWQLLQLAKPQRANASIIVDYAFVIRGLACYSTYGEAEYHENNREQTYGDVLEATHAYALRRFAKRLGIGLELWDKTYSDRFVDRYAVCVRTEDGKKKWRLKSDPPFWNEAGIARRGDDAQDAQRRQAPKARGPARAEAPAAHNPKAEEPITQEQVIRFWTIARRASRSDEEIKAFLLKHYQLDSSKKIKRKDYENICRAAEHPGPLLPVIEHGREPGED